MRQGAVAQRGTDTRAHFKRLREGGRNSSTCVSHALNLSWRRAISLAIRIVKSCNLFDDTTLLAA